MKRQNGFTFEEIIIVISLLAVVLIVAIVLLNPAEKLRESRDAQRISDLSTIKKTLILYKTQTSNQENPSLGSRNTETTQCLTSTSLGGSPGYIFYSTPDPSASGSCIDDVNEGADVTGGAIFKTGTSYCIYDTAATPTLKQVDGTGWIPVNLESIVNNKPISSWPLDPINRISNISSPNSSDLTYRYVCQDQTADSATAYIFEIDARLESLKYTQTNNFMVKDGGDNDEYYEAGTSLKLLGTGTNF